MNYNNLALHAAIATFDLENFNRSLHHPSVDVNYENNEGKTPLMASMKAILGAGYVEKACISTMAISLIRAGCNVNCEDQDGNTPLHRAAAHDLIDVAHELILHGAYIDKRTRDNKTPLFEAISNCKLEAVCLLLYYQADVNGNVGKLNGTHLMQAVETDEINICEVLLDYCDDISCKDEYECTAFTIAVGYQNPIAVDLVKRGASVNSRDRLLNSPLYDSMLYYDSELFKLILPNYVYGLGATFEPYLDRYMNSCNFSDSEWLVCFYLILNSAEASNFIREYENYLQEYNYFSVLCTIMNQLACRNIQLEDRISIFYICLNLGAEVKADQLQFMHLLFGSNDEFEAVVYAGDLSYTDYIEQMRLLFKAPFNSTVPVNMYKNLSRYPTLSKKTFCFLRFFSVSPEARKQFLDWIQIYIPDKRKVILEELDKIPEFPSLLELSRDRAHKFIEEKFKIVKAYQFYDAVKSLKLPPLIEDILLLKQPIY